MPTPIAYLTPDEARALDALVVRLEARTGVQVVPAVVGKADSYVEIPWKAFGLGASFSSLGLVAADRLHPDWVTASTAMTHAVVVLGVAATCALLTVFASSFARLFLRRTRADVEVRQYAESLFLQRALFATRARTGLLVLVSLFERRIEIIADTGFTGRVSAGDWDAVIATMTPHLRNAHPFEALRDALGAIEALLAAKGFLPAAGGANELADTAIQERGQ